MLQLFAETTVKLCGGFYPFAQGSVWHTLDCKRTTSTMPDNYGMEYVQSTLQGGKAFAVVLDKQDTVWIRQLAE